MSRRIAICTVTVALSVFSLGPASAQNSEMTALNKAKTFTCRFTEGRSSEWTVAGIKTSPAPDTMKFVLDQVDNKAGTARMIGNGGGSDVLVVTGFAALSFVELVASGATMTTTIFAQVGSTRDEMGRKRYLSVHSRHFVTALGDSVKAIPQQWFGDCVAM